MLIAVTSSDGVMVDTHFGRADRFLIYEVEEGSCRMIREMVTPAYCSGTGSSHGLMPEKLAAIASGLGDCRVVVTAMIGDAPRAEMERLGVELVTVSAPVSEALKEVVKLY